MSSQIHHYHLNGELRGVLATGSDSTLKHKHEKKSEPKIEQKNKNNIIHLKQAHISTYDTGVLWGYHYVCMSSR